MIRKCSLLLAALAVAALPTVAVPSDAAAQMIISRGGVTIVTPPAGRPHAAPAGRFHRAPPPHARARGYYDHPRHAPRRHHHHRRHRW